MTTIEEKDEPHNIWTALARSTTEAAENTIGRKKKKPKKDQWTSDETIFLIEKKRKLKALQNNSAELREKFKMIKREVQRKARRDHERWLERECKEAEKMHQRSYISGIYRKVKDITSKNKVQQDCIKDSNGDVLMEKSQILHRLRQYTEDLYRKPDNDNSMEPIVVSEEERKPDNLLDEVKDAILLLKNSKAPGKDQIQAELIKEAGNLGAQVMHKLCNTIW